MNDATMTERTTAQVETDGFVCVGAWHCDETCGSIRFVGDQPLPREPGVYAYAVDGIVHYFGSALRVSRCRLDGSDALSVQDALSGIVVGGTEAPTRWKPYQLGHLHPP